MSSFLPRFQTSSSRSFDIIAKKLSVKRKDEIDIPNEVCSKSKRPLQKMALKIRKTFVT
jgi:hypothetical protein